MAHVQATRRTIGSWEIQEVVGSGSFAIVWKARHVTTGTLAAVKEILSDRLNKKLHESLESEIAVLQKLKHANIVGLMDLYKEPGKIFLVLEYCAGGDLAQYLRQRGPLSEASCRYLLRHLAEGLKVLRQHNVMHRDLKPQNLLLSDGGPSPTLKIADFGFARSLQPAGLAETLCGSPLYMAPEVLQLHRYDAKADLWSVGTILFELLTGKPPFNGANHLQLIQNIERGDAVLPEHLARTLSPGCRQLLHQLLRRNPVERISFDEFFAHPFLVGEAASAAVPLPVPGAGGAMGSSIPTGRIAGQEAAPHPLSLQQQPGALHNQRRHTPASHGAVRFIQPARTGSPVHPALAPAPASPSSAAATGQPQKPNLHPQSYQQQQQQQHAPSPGAAAVAAAASAAPAAAAAPQPQPDCPAGAPGLPLAAINVRELTRSPSPRIIATAAAVASAFLGDAAPATTAAATAAAAAAPTTLPVLATVAEAPAGPGAAAAASAGSGALADSLDSDYVVVASPSAAARPPPPAQLSPRTPHPAMACGSGGSGRSSRNASAGGAPPAVAPALQQQQQHHPATAPPPGTANPAVVNETKPLAAAVPTSGPNWQHLLSPIAAATLPGAAPGSAPYPSAAALGLGPAVATHGGVSVNGATTVTIRMPQPGGPEGESGDALLPRVVGLLLDHARSRCTALLDEEAEARQLGDTHAAAAAAAGGGSFVTGGGGGGGGYGTATGVGVGLGVGNLADEAAAAVGTLLVACRLIVAALSASAAAAGREGAAAARRSDSGGDVGDAAAAATRDQYGAVARGPDAERPPGSQGSQETAASGGAAGTPGLAAAAASTAAGPGGSPGPSLAVLAALAVHARALLAALDEHLHGTVARVLLSGADGGEAAAYRPTGQCPGGATHHPAAAAAPQPQPPPVVPCCLDTLLATAVHHSRAAAGEELLGNSAGAADQYGRAADVLLFLLAAPHVQPPPQQHQGPPPPTSSPSDVLWESVRPPLAPHDRQRLTKYYAAVRLRQSAVLAALGHGAGGGAPAGAAAVAPSCALQPPSAHHPYLGQTGPSAHHLQHPQHPLALNHHQLYGGGAHRGTGGSAVTHGSAVAAANSVGTGGYGYGRPAGYGAVVY